VSRKSFGIGNSKQTIAGPPSDISMLDSLAALGPAWRPEWTTTFPNVQFGADNRDSAEMGCFTYAVPPSFLTKFKGYVYDFIIIAP